MSRTTILSGALLYVLLCVLVYVFWLPKDIAFVGDSAVYSRAAVHLVSHGFYSLDGVHAFLEREPLYSVFLAAIYAVFGLENSTAVFAAQCALYLAASIAFVVSFARSGGKNIAAICYVFLLTSPTVFHGLFIAYREAFTLSLMLFLCASMLSLCREPRTPLAVVVGCILGLLPLSYYSFVFLPIALLAFFFLWKIPRRLIAIIIVLASAIPASWALRNAGVDGHFRIIGSDRTAVMWFVRAEQAEKVRGLEPFRCLWSEYVTRDWTGRSEACSFNAIMHARWPDGAVNIESTIAPDSIGRIRNHVASYLWFSVFEILELHLPFVGGGWPFSFNVLAAIGAFLIYAGCLFAWRTFFDRRFALFTIIIAYTTAVFIFTDATPRYLVPVTFCYALFAAAGYEKMCARFGLFSKHRS